MRHVSSRPDPERPWYRHGLVWLVIALPAASVVGGLATLAIAITHADATVADHWYQDGKAINRSLEEERRAEFLGLRLEIDRARGIRLRSDTPLPWPDHLEITLRHPVFAERDRQLRLGHRGDGGYGPADPMPAGGEHRSLPVTVSGDPYAGEVRSATVRFRVRSSEPRSTMETIHEARFIAP